MRSTSLIFFIILLCGRSISLALEDPSPDFLQFSGNPSPMVINSAIPGQPPAAVTNNSTTYTINTATGSKKSILGSLSTPMPNGVTLMVALAAPRKGISQGLVNMTTTNNTLVSDIQNVQLTTGLQVTYQLSATVNAKQMTNQTATLTITLQ